MPSFFAIWTKNTLLENFEKILRISDENSIEKLNVIMILENLLLKIEPSEIPPFFYNNFFGFRGRWGEYSPSPLNSPVDGCYMDV